MFSIIYLDQEHKYFTTKGFDREKITTVFNQLESQGFKVITIYDYSEKAQLYRCSQYDQHRLEILNQLTEYVPVDDKV